MIAKAKEIWLGFSRREKVFLFLSMLSGFLIALDYAIIRPVSQSLFIHSYGSKALPYVWLCSLPYTLAIVALHNYFLPKLGCFRLFCITAGLVALGNLFSGLFIQKVSFLPFTFYMWKEVYVLLMLQQLWSIIHSTISFKNARYLYGILFGFGSLGGFFGSLVPGFLAVRMGSESLLFFTSPIYICLVISYFWLLKHSGSLKAVVADETKKFSSLPEGVRLIFSSRLLLAILLMTAFMQITATITDFQFQTFLEKAYPAKDLRTEFFGKMLSMGNILTMSFQFFGTFLLVHFLGMQRTHFLVPLLLTLSALSFLLFPAFGPIACGFLIIKCFDFSLFGVVKEMLYIPMRPEEKFQAKAIIDVFISRSSKIVASTSILFIQFFFPMHILSMLSWINLAIFLGWCFLIYFLRSSYQDSEQLTLEKRGVS